MNITQLLDLKKIVSSLQIPDDIKENIRKASPQLNSIGIDAWGFDPKAFSVVASLLRWFYTDYFRVEVNGLENIPNGRVMLISNHGCQIPLDAVLIAGALFYNSENPRIVRAMVDRWVPSLPFVSSFFTKMGEIVGAPENCAGLLKDDNCVLIFPEGTNGSGKDIFHRYQLQKFGAGYIHMAVQTNSPIIPVSIVGTEEIYPSLYNAKILARLLKAPYFPITPLFPFFGPLGAIPFPTKVSICFAEPITFPGVNSVSESKAIEMSENVRAIIQATLNKGVEKRGANIFSASAF